jgi:hypothetical protein
MIFLRNYRSWKNFLNFFRTTVQRFKTLKNERYLINYFDIVNQWRMKLDRVGASPGLARISILKRSSVFLCITFAVAVTVW